MDALRQEMERKRKATAELTGGKKWVKKGDIEKARVAQYMEAQALEEEERKKRQAAVAASDAADVAATLARVAKSAAPAASDAAASGAAASGGASSSSAAAGSGAVVEEELRPSDVKRRLRMLAQPIQLYGEGDEERLERYRAVSSALPSEKEVDTSDLKAGQMFNETQLYSESGAAKQEGVIRDEEAGDEEESLQHDEELAATFVPTYPEQIVSRHFKELVQLWETMLNARDAKEAATTDGKRELGTYLQSRRHLRPFFKQLKTRTIPLDVLNTMIEITRHVRHAETRRHVWPSRGSSDGIGRLGAALRTREGGHLDAGAWKRPTQLTHRCRRVWEKPHKTHRCRLTAISSRHMQQREYVKAHDAYIKCAIGSAPWPMGITGTAARSKRKGAS